MAGSENRRSEEDLALIRRMMEEGRREVRDRGQHFMIWGLVGAAGCLVTWLIASGVLAVAPQWVWVSLLVVGWGASMLVGWREGRKVRVRTLGRRMLDVIWISSAITLTLIGLAGLFGSLVPAAALSGLIAVTFGAPLAMTAWLTGESWLNGVAGGWWIGGAVMLFVPGSYHLLLLAAMALVLMAGPGIVLRSRAGRPPVAPAATGGS
ncbi:MAG TPA: hypothetical protein VK966_00625 [Longimicrobiales bacterium]|nr:hypothetical protein [Longimicrobiales bacterium]